MAKKGSLQQDAKYQGAVDQYYANAGKPGGMTLKKGGKSKSSWTGFTQGWGAATFVGIGAFVYYATGSQGLAWHQGAAWIKR